MKKGLNSEALDRKVEKFKKVMTGQFANKKVIGMGLDGEWMKRIERIAKRLDASIEATIWTMFVLGVEQYEQVFRSKYE